MSTPSILQANARDALAQWLVNADWLTELGFPETKRVFAADTAESPTTRPFIVIRWGDQVRRLGQAESRNVDFWIYDDFGDYSRPADAARAIVAHGGREWIPMPHSLGTISHLEFTGEGLGVGGDLADDGFKALVIPVRGRVVGRGL